MSNKKHKIDYKEIGSILRMSDNPELEKQIAEELNLPDNLAKASIEQLSERQKRLYPELGPGIDWSSPPQDPNVMRQKEAEEIDKLDIMLEREDQ